MGAIKAGQLAFLSDAPEPNRPLLRNKQIHGVALFARIANRGASQIVVGHTNKPAPSGEVLQRVSRPDDPVAAKADVPVLQQVSSNRSIGEPRRKRHVNNSCGTELFVT